VGGQVEHEETVERQPCHRKRSCDFALATIRAAARRCPTLFDGVRSRRLKMS
jgi:hypothetical protein